MAASSSSPSSSQAALSLASSLGLSLRPDWLEAAAAAAAARAGGGGHLSSTTSSSLSPLTAEALVSLVLNADLNLAGAGGSLSVDLESLHGRALSGRRIVQVDEVVNAAASAKNRYSVAPLSGRMLKLLLTDGDRHVVAFEMEPVPALSADLPAGCKIAVTDPLVIRGMLALRPANVAVLGGKVPRLEGARRRARAAWSRPPDGRGRAVAGEGGGGGRATLYEEARAAAWPGAAAAPAAPVAAAATPAAGAAAAAVAPAAAADVAPAAAAAAVAPSPEQHQQQRRRRQQQSRAPFAAAPPAPSSPAVIVLNSSDDEDVKTEAGEEAERRQQGPPSFFPLPAAAGPAPASWPRRSLSEAAAAAAAAESSPSPSSSRCLVRGRVAQATSALRFMDARTGEALRGFGLDVELEESPESGGGGGGGGGGRGGGGGDGEGWGSSAAALARRPAALSHAVISGLLDGISPRDLVEQYAREGGREAVLGRLGAVKAFLDGFDGWLGVEAGPPPEKREGGGGGGGSGGGSSVATTPPLVVVGWWEA